MSSVIGYLVRLRLKIMEFQEIKNMEFQEIKNWKSIISTIKKFDKIIRP